MKTASCRLPLLRQPRIPPSPPELPVNPGTLEGQTPLLAALIALDIPREIEAAVAAALIDDTHHVMTLTVVAIAPGIPQSDLEIVTWRSAVATMTSVISATSVAIDPRGAAVAGQPGGEYGTETVIASASVKEIAARTETERDLGIETGTVIVTESDLDLVNEITTGTDLIVAAIEVEIGIVVVVTIIVLNELDTLGLPPVDARARGLGLDIAVGSATVHVHDLLFRDGARVPSPTRGGGHGLVADHPHDGLLPALLTSTVMCL